MAAVDALFGLNIVFMMASGLNSRFCFQSLIAAVYVNLHIENFYTVGGLSSYAYVFMTFYVASLIVVYMRQ